MIATDQLEALLLAHLPRQRWFAAGDGTPLEVVVRSATPLREAWPRSLHVVAEVVGDGTSERYQLVIGLRPVDELEVFLEGKVEAYLGDVETDDGPARAYDAVYDAELAIDLLHRFAPEIEAERARVLQVEQSNTSIVYDEHHILKLFRRLSAGGNPDVEVTTALRAVGFEGVPAPEAVWQRDGDDLAVVNEFLAGGSEGFSLALTSLRDLYDRRCPPEECGGDFAPEARRLGIVTGRLHLAMAEAFGTTDPAVGSWVADMGAQLDRVRDAGFDGDAVRAVYDRLAAASDVGRAIRIHGDLHLGQVMRTDAGWYVLDFEGEPDRPVEERRRPSSPLRDVAGMLRSFHYAAEVALRDRGEEVTEELAALAAAWEARNTFAFSEGYRAVKGIDALLPPDDATCALVQTAFELDKALYEVAYEAAHRPDWAVIPRAAVDRLLETR